MASEAELAAARLGWPVVLMGRDTLHQRVSERLVEVEDLAHAGFGVFSGLLLPDGISRKRVLANVARRATEMCVCLGRAMFRVHGKGGRDSKRYGERLHNHIYIYVWSLDKLRASSMHPWKANCLFDIAG